jgi:hypothetical protein
MKVYRHLSDWQEFQSKVLSKGDSPKTLKMTEYIDHLLFHGGGIRDIHRKIIDEQTERGSNGYKSLGYLFDKKGNVQQRTFFGHIAHLIKDEGLIIVFGEVEINTTKPPSEGELTSQYNRNERIRIEGFKSERRNDELTPITEKQKKSESSQGEIPSRDYVERILRLLGGEADENKFKRTIEAAFAKEGRMLSPDWWIITKKNLIEWSRKG